MPRRNPKTKSLSNFAARMCREISNVQAGNRHSRRIPLAPHCILYRNRLTWVQRHQQSGQEKACRAELVNQATSRKVANGGLYVGGWTCWVKTSEFINGQGFVLLPDLEFCRDLHENASLTKSL